MIQASKAAGIVCAATEFSISHLSLQKIMYLAQMTWMGKYDGGRLIDTDFEAWDYGPVSKEVFDVAKAFGRNKIPNIWPPSKTIMSQEKAHLEDVAKKLSKWSSAQLVSLTHMPNGAWAKNYRPGVHHILIPDADIFDEFKTRLRANGPKERGN
jgi:uncharacterized phage-associated protein